MNSKKIQPFVIVLVVVALFVVWQWPEYAKQNQEYQNSRHVQEREHYLSVKEHSLDLQERKEVDQIYGGFEAIRLQIDTGAIGNRCPRPLPGPAEPRLMAWNLLQSTFPQKGQTFNGNADFLSALHSSLGDGFSSDFSKRNYHGGLHYYLKNLERDRVLFVVQLQKLDPPRMSGESIFSPGSILLKIFACDLPGKKVLCQRDLKVNSPESSRGAPLKEWAMNAKLLEELEAEALKEVKAYCTRWTAE